MKTLEEITKALKEMEPELAEKYRVKSLAVFGSYARNTQKEGSDIDILVDFSGPVGFEFFRAQRFIGEKLGLKADLVTRDAIKPGTEHNIIKDLVHV
ncbi:MAG TPA: nucleotidyltransferase [Firmicutes bacterium]|nr:nucleotidyltransferase [Bacillota bacterium]